MILKRSAEVPLVGAGSGEASSCVLGANGCGLCGGECSVLGVVVSLSCVCLLIGGECVGGVVAHTTNTAPEPKPLAVCPDFFSERRTFRFGTAAEAVRPAGPGVGDVSCLRSGVNDCDQREDSNPIVPRLRKYRPGETPGPTRSRSG